MRFIKQRKELLTQREHVTVGINKMIPITRIHIGIKGWIGQEFILIIPIMNVVKQNGVQNIHKINGNSLTHK